MKFPVPSSSRGRSVDPSARIRDQRTPEEQEAAILEEREKLKQTLTKQLEEMEEQKNELVISNAALEFVNTRMANTLREANFKKLEFLQKTILKFQERLMKVTLLENDTSFKEYQESLKNTPKNVFKTQQALEKKLLKEQKEAEKKALREEKEQAAKEKRILREEKALFLQKIRHETQQENFELKKEMYELRTRLYAQKALLEAIGVRAKDGKLAYTKLSGSFSEIRFILQRRLQDEKEFFNSLEYFTKVSEGGPNIKPITKNPYVPPDATLLNLADPSHFEYLAGQAAQVSEGALQRIYNDAINIYTQRHPPPRPPRAKE